MQNKHLSCFSILRICRKAFVSLHRDQRGVSYTLTLAIVLPFYIFGLACMIELIRLSAIVAGILIAGLSQWTDSVAGIELFQSMLGASACFLVLLPFFLTRGIGGGDVKLAAASGAITGFAVGIEILLFGFVLAVVYALVLKLVSGFRNRPSQDIAVPISIPLAPFFSIGAIIALL